MNRRTRIILTEQLIREIDSVAGGRQRRSCLTQAAEKELMRRRQLQALDSLVAWNAKIIPS